MRYWTRKHNILYEINKRKERFYLWLATKMSGDLRKWVVVDSTNTARDLYPDEDGYAGPDGLGFQEIYDGAIRQKTRGN